eukprot:392267-Pyramimonas_sp.AAC.1
MCLGVEGNGREAEQAETPPPYLSTGRSPYVQSFPGISRCGCLNGNFDMWRLSVPSGYRRSAHNHIGMMARP